MIQPKTHVRVGRQVEHRVAARHRRGQSRQVEVIAPHQLEIRRLLRLGQKVALPGGEVIPTSDSLALPQEQVHEAAANESGGAGDEYVLQEMLSVTTV